MRGLLSGAALCYAAAVAVHALKMFCFAPW